MLNLLFENLETEIIKIIFIKLFSFVSIVCCQKVSPLKTYIEVTLYELNRLYSITISEK